MILPVLRQLWTRLCGPSEPVPENAPEAGWLPAEPVPFGLRPLAESVLDPFRSEGERKRLEIFFEIEDGLPEAVSGDEKGIQQVLINLVGNAVKSTDLGGVALRIRKAPEYPAPRDLGPSPAPMDTGRLVFEVEDTGAGISPEDQSAIARLFSRSAGAADRPGESDARGLSASHRMVERMGGSLGFRSWPGRGSVFHFDAVLPAASPPPAQEAGPAPEAPADGNASPPPTVPALPGKGPEPLAALDRRQIQELDEMIRTRDLGFWERSFRQFRLDTARLLAAARVAAEDGRATEACEAAHSLKGVSLMLGFTRIGGLSKELEIAIRDRRTPAWRGKLEEIEAAVEPTLSELLALLALLRKQAARTVEELAGS